MKDAILAILFVVIVVLWCLPASRNDSEKYKDERQEDMNDDQELPFIESPPPIEANKAKSSFGCLVFTVIFFAIILLIASIIDTCKL